MYPEGTFLCKWQKAGTPEFVFELVEQLRSMILQLVSRSLEESLETEPDRFLGRKGYMRRRRSKRKETGVYGSQCRSHQRQDFRRNGYYRRQLAALWGRVSVQIPQAKCQCGGNVRLSYQTLRSGQRLWEDLQLEIQAEYGRGLSYRQIKVDLDRRLASSVGLRTLNQQVLGAESDGFAWLSPGEIPPVVQVDGIWVTVMFATGETETGRAGRKRPVKRAKKVPNFGCLRRLAEHGTDPIVGLDAGGRGRCGQLADLPGKAV